MTAQQKKQIERAMLHGLLTRLNIPANFLLGQFESPDLVVVLEGQTIGVEVTEIQKSREERAKRAPKDDILKRCRIAYELKGGPPVSVSLSFLDEADLRSSNRAEISQRIVELLMWPDHDIKFEVHILNGERLPAELRQHIQEIRFWGESDVETWQCIEAASVDQLTTQVLQERVDAKNLLLPAYRKKGYGAYWLLICADPINPACRFEAARDFDPAQVRSPFDRTFFYDGWHALELGQAT